MPLGFILLQSKAMAALFLHEPFQNYHLTLLYYTSYSPSEILFRSLNIAKTFTWHAYSRAHTLTVCL